MNNTAKKQVMNGAHEAQEVIGDLRGNLSEAGHQAVEAGQQAYEAGKKAVHDIADAGTKVAHDLSETGKEKLKTYTSEGRKQLAGVEDYIREHPVKSVLISAAAGILINKFLKS